VKRRCQKTNISPVLRLSKPLEISTFIRLRVVCDREVGVLGVCWV
jgi:hypothetical protein